EMFLEGVKERERRRAMAVEVTGEAQKARRNYHRVRDRLRELRRELDRKRLELPATASMDDKEELWELEQRVDDLQVEVERAFGRATRLYDQALGHQPDMERARRALADLYWERFREYEARGERARAAYFEGLVRRYNDGQYDDLLEGMATVHLETSPAGADAELCRYEEVNHRLVEKRIERAGPTPTEPLRVEHGSYVFEVDLDGHVPVNVPVRLERLDERNLDVELYRSGEIPEDFVVVPGGPFLSGEVRFGEPERDEEYLPDYAIKRHPVTCREYLDFLNALAAGGDLNAAKQHAPRQPDGPSYFPLEEGRFRIPEEDRDGDAWDPDWPICMINFHSAQAYADWRSTRDDRTYRLPTAEEWEKAARGVDGRTYPWGDNFDPSFCHMQDSREGRPMPAPVGSYAIDRSPYGAMDMAGNVSEWTSTTPSGSPSWRVVQGASFASVDLMCRLDWNMQAEADQRKTLFGFRLVTPLDED
ncbi:MAG: formylglycine-generating enzyme family protein, partial [Bradymonadaceae bacterium]